MKQRGSEAGDVGKMMVKGRNKVRKKTRGKALHFPAPFLIRKYNTERGLRWIKCGR